MAKRKKRKKSVDIRSIKDIKASLNMHPIIDEYAAKTIETLRKKGPANQYQEAQSSDQGSPHSDRPGRGNEAYRLGWDVKELRTIKSGYKLVVWNKTNWQLTHLLEKGHVITNTEKGRYVPPKAHIKPTYDNIAPKFIKAMKDVEIELEII